MRSEPCGYCRSLAPSKAIMSALYLFVRPAVAMPLVIKFVH